MRLRVDFVLAQRALAQAELRRGFVQAPPAEEACAVLDGGGRVKTALNVVRGAERIARLYAGLSKKVDPDFRYEIREVNAWPALVILEGPAIVSVTALETDGTVVFGLSVCQNPAKLVAMSRNDRLTRP